MPLMTTAPLFVMSQREFMRTIVPAPMANVAPAPTVIFVVMWMRELAGHETLPLRVPEICTHGTPGASRMIPVKKKAWQLREPWRSACSCQKYLN